MLSFAEVVSRRKDKPLPLQPSDLSGTTFDGFSLKRIKKKKRCQEALDKQSGLVSLPSAASRAGSRPVRGLRDAWRGRRAQVPEAACCRSFLCAHRLLAMRPGFQASACCFLACTLWGGIGTHARSQSHMFQKFDLRTAFFPPQERDVWRKCSR